MRNGLALAAALAVLTAGACPALAQPGALNERLGGDISPVHDPAIIKAGDTYYLFNTSQANEPPGLIHIRTSKDLVTWTRAGAVFPAIPEWAAREIGGAKGIWAPDISYVGGVYRLYYAVSTFGSNHSVIGLATSPTLDQSSPDYRWTDQGEVITSTKAGDYNAIDPNLVVDHKGGQWLAFGSFWTGLKLVGLDPATGKPPPGERKLISLARRPSPDAIEAPFIIHHGDFYYLFASFDFCCRGVNSTYYTIVGRSPEITGPYVNYDGKPLMQGYAQIVLHGDLDKTHRFRGPGHIGIVQSGGREIMVWHAYDASNKGAPTLRVAPIGWTPDGWPVVTQ